MHKIREYKHTLLYKVAHYKVNQAFKNLKYICKLKFGLNVIVI
jgi:hypothetical protein